VTTESALSNICCGLLMEAACKGLVAIVFFSPRDKPI
jgi:hypothetical protein